MSRTWWRSWLTRNRPDVLIGIGLVAWVLLVVFGPGYVLPKIFLDGHYAAAGPPEPVFGDAGGEVIPRAVEQELRNKMIQNAEIPDGGRAAGGGP